MKTSVAIFLQTAVVLLGLGALTLLLGEPHLEGRNAHATTFEIYFKDPFLAFVYLGSTPFFVALYRAFGLVGNARHRGAFSASTVAALRSIKSCALIILGFVVVGVGIILVFGDPEDRPAGLFMSLLVAVGAAVAAGVAARLARTVQEALARIDGGPPAAPAPTTL